MKYYRGLLLFSPRVSPTAPTRTEPIPNDVNKAPLPQQVTLDHWAHSFDAASCKEIKVRPQAMNRIAEEEEEEEEEEEDAEVCTRILLR